MLPPPGRRRPDLPGAPEPSAPVKSTTPAAPAARHSRTLSPGRRIGLTPVQRKVTPAEEAAFATLEVEVGGRARLVSALSLAHLPPEIDLILGMLADPTHDGESLAQICALAGVKFAKILPVFKEAVKARGQVISTARIAERMPDLAAAVVDDAIPGWRECRECLGAREIAAPTPEDPHAVKPCPECRGRGQVWFVPDHDVQKTALKISGLLESGTRGGATVNVLQKNTQIAPGDTGGFDALMTMMDDALYGSGRDRLARMRPQTPMGADSGASPAAEVVEGTTVDDSADAAGADADEGEPEAGEAEGEEGVGGLEF